MSNQYHASVNDLSAVREICEQYGFCLIKGVLSQGDLDTVLAGMRAASQAADGAIKSDLLGLPEVRDIYFDSRILTIAHALLGPALVYDGEGTMNFEEAIGTHTLKPYSELHCDAKGMPDSITATWRSPTDAIYRAYRFGIYFQDYRHASGALKVIVGSHRGDPDAYLDSNLLRAGSGHRMVGGNSIDYPQTTHPLHNLPSQPGDVVVWNLRTFHSAGAKLFSDDPTFAVHPTVEANITAQAPGLFAPPPGPRNAVFFDYAAPCEEIDLYIKLRARPVVGGVGSRLDRRSDDPAALDLADKYGIAVRHDGLITALALALATNGSADPVRRLNPAEVQVAAKRLHALLQRHVEYSPYFRLFDRELFARAPNSNIALNTAIGEITRPLFAKKAPA